MTSLIQTYIYYYIRNRTLGQTLTINSHQYVCPYSYLLSCSYTRLLSLKFIVLLILLPILTYTNTYALAHTCAHIHIFTIFGLIDKLIHILIFIIHIRTSTGIQNNTYTHKLFLSGRVPIGTPGLRSHGPDALSLSFKFIGDNSAVQPLTQGHNAAQPRLFTWSGSIQAKFKVCILNIFHGSPKFFFNTKIIDLNRFLSIKFTGYG